MQSSELIKNEKELIQRESYMTEDEILSDLLKLGNIVNFYLRSATSLQVTNNKINKEYQALLVGHMCRITKLFDASLLLLQENKYDTSLPLLRLIVEALLIYKYIAKNINDNSLWNKIIKSSLVPTKESYNIYAAQPKEDIYAQKKMVSILDEFKQYNIKIEEINVKKDRYWYDAKKLAADLNMTDLYNIAFRTLSGMVHGSWHCLSVYYLKKIKNSFEPQFVENFSSVHPFFMLYPGLLEMALSHVKLVQNNGCFVDCLSRTIQLANRIRSRVLNFENQCTKVG